MLTGGILLVVLAVVLVLGLSADYLTRYIPFRYEQNLAQRFEATFSEPHAYEAALRPLGEKLAAAMQLPDDMPVVVHFADNDVVNAFATFGGHVVIHRGLVEKLESENALAMVLAHEIAHIKHRHPIRSLGRGAVVILALMAITGVQGDDIVGTVAGNAGSLTLLSFSRAQEKEADRTALEALEQVYGHTAGALNLYELLVEERANHGSNVPEFLSTHPLTEARIADLRELALTRGWRTQGDPRPLPHL